MKTEFLDRLGDRLAVIGVIGLGYVGLPLALRFAQAGFKVVGLDTDQARVDSLNRGCSYIGHISDAQVQAALEQSLRATVDFSRVAELDAVIICVPTPLTAFREPDLSHVLGALEACLPYLRAGQLISLESTTYPGTTEERLLPRIASTGLTPGRDVFVAYSPERADPGNEAFATRAIPKLCAGVTPACRDVGVALYASVIDRVVPMSSTRAAEMTKLLENIHRAVNIGLVNEMKVIADKMDIDIHEVIRAAATKPFGFVPYYPGPGLGGHCIPVDPFYLTWKAREFGVHTRFVELAGEVNAAMPHYVIDKLSGALNARQKAMNGSRILMIGLAYKKNIDDLRESPALLIMGRLNDLGASIEYSDPYVPTLAASPAQGRHLHSLALDASTLAGFDCVMIVTDHDSIDYLLIEQHAQLIVDCRGRYRQKTTHIVQA
ncbi:nucleotide sugar dehydrogenase [Pseudomonas sp. RIT-PI-S]|uniref:nucleotide sugar dehydrogenase n=1 Tax=Pseudomonas sp. RIT-PI-S TaxID=3035295 RepID=UPI0021D9333D|nr:nucleotide sugar dehydrogenase [Pseudomonas sp. RIT-PI-S]